MQPFLCKEKENKRKLEVYKTDFGQYAPEFKVKESHLNALTYDPPLVIVSASFLLSKEKNFEFK